MRFDSKKHGEEQALALREREEFFHRSAGACPPQSLECADDSGEVPFFSRL